MVTADERLKVLQMIQEGKLTPEAAAQLLQAMDAEPNNPPAPFAQQTASSDGPSLSRARWLHVRVTDAHTGRPRVNVRLPLSLVNIGMKLGARYAPEIEGMDLAMLLEAVQAGEPGPFVDVMDEEDGEHVEVFLE